MDETKITRWKVRIPPGKSIKTREGQVITNTNTRFNAELIIEAQVRKDAEVKKEDAHEKSTK